MNSLLSVEHLQTAFKHNDSWISAVQDMTFEIHKGEILGVVGESGSGKSVTALSIMRLLGSNGKIVSGDILFDGDNLVRVSEKRMQEIRGNEISMIFQEPMTSLNPVLTIGYQLGEVIRLHMKMDRQHAREYAEQMLIQVGIPRAGIVLNDYPHSLSGGMRQRVMIAMALACHPRILIADEPTTALDVTIQFQILELMRQLSKKYETAILLITHDLGVIAEMADRVMVVYAGQIVEEANVFTLFHATGHPYTKALMRSIPHLKMATESRLEAIKGMVPVNYHTLSGCRFFNRCSCAEERCERECPSLRDIGGSHMVRCWKA